MRRDLDDERVNASIAVRRLLHRSVVFNIDGESYRIRAHRARADKLRKAVKPTIAEPHPPTTRPITWGISMIETGEFP